MLQIVRDALLREIVEGELELLEHDDVWRFFPHPDSLNVCNSAADMCSSCTGSALGDLRSDLPCQRDDNKRRELSMLQLIYNSLPERLFSVFDLGHWNRVRLEVPRRE